MKTKQENGIKLLTVETFLMPLSFTSLTGLVLRILTQSPTLFTSELPKEAT